MGWVDVLLEVITMGFEKTRKGRWVDVLMDVATAVKYGRMLRWLI